MQKSMIFPRRAELNKGQPLGIPGKLRRAAATGGPVLAIDLAAAACQLQQESTWSANRNAVTLVKHPDFRLVLTALKTGARVAHHSARGTVLIHVLTGHVRATIYGEDLDLEAGQILSLDPNLDHDITAVSDAQLLITIGWGEMPGPIVQPFAPADAGWDWQADDSVWN